MSQADGVLLGVVLFGLLHGANPSHGWPVAILYSIRSKRPLLGGIKSSGIIASAHFLSSVVVVAAYLAVTTFVQIPQLYLNYAVAAALGILAYMFWKGKPEDLAETQHGHLHHDQVGQFEHSHEHWHAGVGNHTHMHIHQKQMLPTLSAIAAFALVLGFAHEEEFVILALAAGGTSPVLLIVAYAGAVSASLVGITMIAVKAYARIEHRVIPYAKYLPKFSAVVLAAMAAGFALGLL